MSLSEICIRRPVGTILLSMAVVAAGLFGARFLPVAALPRVDLPTISVSAQLPGASPDTMANSVATPLIKQFATIAGIDQISSSSTLGATSIVLEFGLDRDIDAAAVDVQAAIARAQRQLPDDMTTPPSYRKQNPADAPVILLALSSDTMRPSDLDGFAEDLISPMIATLPGVAQVSVYGAQKYAVRIEVDPDALNARGMSLDDLEAAVKAANDNSPIGTLRSGERQLTLQTTTQLVDAAAFRDLIVATRNGQPVRLGDVARAIDSVENDQAASAYDAKRSIVLAVQRQPDANTVAVVDAVRGLLPTIENQLPPAASIHVLNDRAVSVRSAVEDVGYTLALTVALVVLVIYLFLGRLSATVVPTLAVPISLVGALGAMQMLGLSIDNISLLGLTLSVGLVVDDAIVMLENIVRHVENGMRPFEAALVGSREVGFTIVSMTLSLVAVFLPVLLMGGVVGKLFNEFGLVVTLAIAASAVVSLTLTPMLCARLPAHHETGGRSLFERGFDAVTRGYGGAVGWCLGHRPVVLAAFLASVAATVFLVTSIPKGFLPQEDIGQVSVTTEARPDISFEAMWKLQAQAADALRASPHVAHVASIVSSGGFGGGLNTGRIFVELKPREERPPMASVLADIRGRLAPIAGLRSYANAVQNLTVGGRSSKSPYQLVIQGIDKAALDDWSNKLMAAMQADPRFVGVTTDLQNRAAQATVVVDKDKAAALGIVAATLHDTLYGAFGTEQASTIYATGDSYEVIVEYDPRIPWTPDRLNELRVPSASGTLIPLGAFARVEETVGPLSVNQTGQLPSVTLSFDVPPGTALGDATARIEALKGEIGFPATLATSYAGSAKVFQDSQGNQMILVIAAVATIYVILGVLYESFIHPVTILSGLPAAAIGAVGALWLLDMPLDVIGIIGVLMLIGIVKKNAIMMVDVAVALMREEGLAAREAIHRACVLRLRPIMMTTFAALLGALPIALGLGASAELRQPLGVAVVGGLIVSQLLTLFITPVIFLEFERLRGLVARLRRPRVALAGSHEAPAPSPAE